MAQNGLQAVNMRMVAKACNVAVGSVYNYFPSKAALITAAIESVWHDIFHMEHCCNANMPFDSYVLWIYESVQKSASEYPGFLTAHSLSFESLGKSKAEETMHQYLLHIKKGLSAALKADKGVKQNAFSETFSKECFLEFVLSNLLMLLTRPESSCEALLEIIKRAIYR